jgi:5-methylcytosine-specific restriction endonuclease McrA
MEEIVYKALRKIKNKDKPDEQFEIRVNDIFGKLKVISSCENVHNKPGVKCICECNNYYKIEGYKLLSKLVRSCGCDRPSYNVGDTVKNILILRKIAKEDLNEKQSSVTFLCKCFCGKEFKYTKRQFRTNIKISCGCLNEDCETDPWKIAYGLKIYDNDYRRKLDFELNLDEFTILSKQNCYYCNTEPSIKLPLKETTDKRNTIDRIDNSIGYIYNNCIGACAACNRMKGKTSIDNFIFMIKNIYENLKLNNSSGIIKNNFIRPKIIGNYNKKDPYYRFYKRYMNVNSNGRKLDFELSNEDFELFISSDCYYCDKKSSIFCNYSKIMRNGIDRIDSEKGYLFENCVPCCFECNVSKWDLEVNEFISKIKLIYENLNICNNEVYVVNANMEN